MNGVSRRNFARLFSVAAAGTAVAPLGRLNARTSLAPAACDPSSFTVAGFGPLVEAIPENTFDLSDVPGAGDLSGVPLLRLPEKFRYTAISIRGQLMSDGNLVPGDHDGMACFPAPGGNFALVRNHELDPDEAHLGAYADGTDVQPDLSYDFGVDGAPLPGGTTTLVYNLKTDQVERSFQYRKVHF